jgi:ABC-type nitrate/sulfonate/bicarbonate transport system permease component
MVMVTVVLGEVLGADGGLGYEIQQSVNTYQIARSYALITFLVLLSSVLLWAMERALRTNRHG